MSDPQPRVDLVLLWHHHQPDYRDPRDGRALLPWVRLHATKDYLDMARRLERHPRVRCTFNFVPSLLDQLEQAGEGAGDALFDLLRKPIADLAPDERDAVRGRVTSAPRHAFDRWPGYRALAVRSAMSASDAASDDALLGLECWFLLAWVDPMFLEAPEAVAALGAAEHFTAAHRDGLLALHDRLLRDVVPAYRDIAARAQVELSASAYFHPILPLLIDNAAARRSRPDARLPEEPFAFPEDADRQIARALDRHARVFGVRPRGMWPPEGSVSPEAIERLARAGVAWAASDEGVLWASLDASERRREALYRPWRFDTGAGAMTLLFRDRELSDRIGFVYQNWNPAAAAEDFVSRLKRIGDEHGATTPATVCVALDGENCWEHYADDGGPFLDALYTAIAAAPGIRTLTPSDVVDSGREVATLARLHSGSWIDADFHIWIGHAEKNRAWDLIARTRRALVQAGTSPELAPAWEALDTAEGSDWFWWLGEDHFTRDKALFDQLFRAQLRAAHERAGLPAPAWLDAPIARPSHAAGGAREPFGFVRPTLDGRRTGYYEWHGAARFVLGAGGGSMHRGVGRARELHVGSDAERLYVRVDFDDQGAPGKDWDLVIELAAPEQARLVARRLVVGEGAVERDGSGAPPVPLAGARWVLDAILEMSIPFASMGVASGQTLELVARLTKSGAVIETLPADDIVRLRVPSAADEARSWSA